MPPKFRLKFISHRSIKYNSFYTLYCEARAIHAFLLRCEGLSLRQIGLRLENIQRNSQVNNFIGAEQARLLVKAGAERLNYAMRKTRFYLKKDDGYEDGFDPLT